MALSARDFALPDNKEWYPCPLTHAKSLEPVCNLCTLDGPSRRELLGTVLVQAAGLVDLLTSSTKWDTEVDLSKLAQSEVLMPSQALVCIIFDEWIWMEENVCIHPPSILRLGHPLLRNGLVSSSNILAAVCLACLQRDPPEWLEIAHENPGIFPETAFNCCCLGTSYSDDRPKCFISLGEIVQ